MMQRVYRRSPSLTSTDNPIAMNSEANYALYLVTGRELVPPGTVRDL